MASTDPARKTGAIALALFASLCLTMDGCSSGQTVSHRLTSTSTVGHGAPWTSKTHTYLASDADSDRDDSDRSYALEPSEHDSFVGSSLGAGATPPDRRAIARLLVRYYAAAAAGDGAAGCALLSRSLAGSMAIEANPSHSESCATALSRVFAQQHSLLAEDEVSTMSVVEVRVKGGEATALVGFRRMPVGIIRLLHEDGTWRLNALFDRGLD